MNSIPTNFISYIKFKNVLKAQVAKLAQEEIDRPIFIKGIEISK